MVVFRSSSTGQPQIGKMVACSKRQVRGFVGCHAMLESGCYLVVCVAFNHWHTGENLWKVAFVPQFERVPRVIIDKFCIFVADSGVLE